MLFAIVPAYNEETRLPEVIRGLLGVVDRVVVVNDGSGDNTAPVASEAGAVVLSHGVNRGQGAALETGHAYAREHGALHVVHFDADGQFDVGDIMPALARMREMDVDVLFGSRFLDGRSNMPWFKRWIIHPIARLVSRLTGGLPLKDAHNGFRILSRKAFNTITITQDRMAHATEIPVLVKRAGLSYVEHPVKVTYHEYGQGAAGGVRVVMDLLFGSFIK